MKKMIFWVRAGVLIFVLALTSCGGDQPAASSEEDIEEVAPNSQNPLEENVNPQPEEIEQSNQQPEPASAAEGSLSAERQSIEITTSDDRTLEGFYFPAKTDNAPLVVLMHWAPGTMADWDQITAWLQNRPGEADAPSAGKGAFHDPGWFPAMPEEVSFAVLVFNFGKYGSSQYGGSSASYVVDAEAALQHAACLPGVDSHRITTIGASIGADGVVDGCYLFNDMGEKGTCIGALSLSPGNYLTDKFSYQFAVEMINLSGYPVWCLAAEKDGASPELCRAIPGPLNQAFIYSGSYHGMELVDPGLFPADPAVELNTLELVQEFLEKAYGIKLNDLALP